MSCGSERDTSSDSYKSESLSPVASPFGKTGDAIIDTFKIDLRIVSRWLENVASTRSGKKLERHFIADLTIDYLRTHRYPDLSVIQAQIIDLSLLNTNASKDLIELLRTELLEQQKLNSADQNGAEAYSKYQRIGTTEAPKKLGTHQLYTNSNYNRRDERSSPNKHYSPSNSRSRVDSSREKNSYARSRSPSRQNSPQHLHSEESDGSLSSSSSCKKYASRHNPYKYVSPNYVGYSSYRRRSATPEYIRRRQ